MQKERMTRNRKLSVRFLLPCLISALMIGVCSKSSPLYPMNDWVDVNCFFTVGRGMLHGMVPYLDLYEQKGPLIYFLYALSALISEHSFLGVYLVETACFAVFLHYGAKIAEKLSGASWAYPLTAAIVGFVIPITPAFSHGSSAEELILPVLAFGMYTVTDAMTDGRKIRTGEGVLLGAAAAAALWSKYTFCGLFAGLALGVVIDYLIKGWHKDFFRLIGTFLLGTAGLSALIVLWFALHGALSAMWDAYFMNNLTLYSQNIRGGHYDPPLLNLLNNLTWTIPAAVGLLVPFFRKGRRLYAVTMCLSAVALFAFTYLSGRRYPYYALILSVFAPLGPGAVFDLISHWTQKHSQWVGRAAAVLTGILVLAAPCVSSRISQNAYLMGTPKEELPQYRFAARIQETEEQTILNSGFLDGGFYFAAGVLPSSPYFCTLNISLPEMEQSLRQSVENGETAYVVTREKKLAENAPYRLIDESSFLFEGRSWRYYLYRRLDLEEKGDS